MRKLLQQFFAIKNESKTPYIGVLGYKNHGYIINDIIYYGGLYGKK